MNFEEVRTTEVTYSQLTGGVLTSGMILRNKKAFYGNPISTFHANAANRYLDAKRNIANNKQEIIDFAEAAIAIDYPDYYFPSDVITNSWSRFKDAYRMIQKNKARLLEWRLMTLKPNILLLQFLQMPNVSEISNF